MANIKATPANEKKVPIMLLLISLFIIIPLIEIAIFINVGGAIGIVPTLLTIVLTAVIGAWLVRGQFQELMLRFNRDPGSSATHVEMVSDGLLSKEVYDRFIDVIEHRGKSGKKVELTFVGIRDSSFKSASLSGNNARITIKFVSEIISATYDSDGKVIEGDPARVVTVDDIWTFARELESEDVNWLLISTSNVDVDSL